jgi:hypothetical protein
MLCSDGRIKITDFGAWFSNVLGRSVALVLIDFKSQPNV